MRILWITPGFAANEQDHNCIPPLQGLARELLRQGVDLHIVALEYPFTHPKGLNFSNFKLQISNFKLKNQGPKPPKTLHWQNATIYPCNGQNRRALRWRTQGRARRFAQQLFAEKKFDAIHSFWLGPAWVIGEQLAKRWNIPHYCTLMGQDALPRNWWYQRRLKPEHSSRLIALSAFHNATLEQSTGLRATHCIPWGIEQQDQPTHFSTERPIDILGVGSLIPVKNWTRWLRVLRQVADIRPKIRAELIGSGPEQQQLQALIERLQLDEQVALIGNLPRLQVLERMRQSRVLLHTANFESFGFVFLEAAANGCRVVSTAVGIAPELGVCAGTDAGLAEAIRDTLAQTRPATTLTKWSMGGTAQAYLALYAGKG